MSNFPLNIIFFGNGPRGEACLLKLISASKKISLIIGHFPESSIKDIANKYNIKYISPNKINTDSIRDILVSYKANLFILCGYNKILKPIILDIPYHKVINCHGGKLPEYRGAAPINWQLINGESEVGFSILYADKGIDTGRLIRTTRFTIDFKTDANDLVYKSLSWFPKNLLHVIDQLEGSGKIISQEQIEKDAKHYTRRYPEDGLVDWKNSTDIEIYNLTRALVKPYPGAYTYNKNNKVVLNKLEILDKTYIGVAGRISMVNKEGVIVSCKNRSILIKDILVKNKEIKANEYFKTGDLFKNEIY